MGGFLTDRQIKKYQFKGGGMITPFVSRKTGNPSHGLSSAGYDIRLGDEFIYFADPVIDPCFGDEISPPPPIVLGDLKNHGGTTKSTKTDNYVLRPGSFVLAHSLEVFEIPTDVIGFVYDKSTLARIGLALQNTVLEPGWKGQITLEISNHGECDVILQPGVGIAQVLLFRLDEDCEKPYGDGKYQNQEGVVTAK